MFALGYVLDRPAHFHYLVVLYDRVAHGANPFMPAFGADQLQFQIVRISAGDRVLYGLLQTLSVISAEKCQAPGHVDFLRGIHVVNPRRLFRPGTLAVDRVELPGSDMRQAAHFPEQAFLFQQALAVLHSLRDIACRYHSANYLTVDAL